MIARVGIRRTLGGDCAIYDGWRDQLEMRLGHEFQPSNADDCPDNVSLACTRFG